MSLPQYTDPSVSHKKFDREIAEFRRLDAEYRQRGWFLVHAEYPDVFVLMASPKLSPGAIVTAVSFDYTNYDAAPPSVKLVNPFTGQPYKASELPTQLLRALPEQQLQLAGAAEGAPAIAMQAAQPLMQALAPTDIPFLCLAGVREYHEHPAHSGDVWDLHRAAGAGRLVRLLEIISRYGVEPITGYSVQMIPKIGFLSGHPPS
jgi:hypothetical protein